VLAFASFIGIVWWAYSSKRKHSFDEAANLALDDEDRADRGGGAGQQHN
jgi:cytochrome c oxidase cbb3-type subunit 4